MTHRPAGNTAASAASDQYGTIQVVSVPQRLATWTWANPAACWDTIDSSDDGSAGTEWKPEGGPVSVLVPPAVAPGAVAFESISRPLMLMTLSVQLGALRVHLSNRQWLLAHSTHTPTNSTADTVAEKLKAQRSDRLM